MRLRPLTGSAERPADARNLLIEGWSVLERVGGDVRIHLPNRVMQRSNITWAAPFRRRHDGYRRTT
ncbi:hypothetical protein DSC45_34320 [Streptomyces sp. YIM 130001]|uniref:hypothetical protein n=1 Tax=Streptomyces sp. YIM 130001 TaxID=2259644 RepID=UPI000E64B652|nr:hypothetical protein [Streptomyces sp. YIM 130001]RII07903.1 hypothetical protein DSC45_34320 [Streptomyces sp. YIM 130001]